MKRPSLAAFAATTAILSHPAMADDALDLGTIYVSGNLVPVEATRTGATIDTPAKDVSKAVTRPISETLARTPGISFSRNGGMGSATTLRLRGLPGQYVGVRLNGINVSDPSRTQAQYNYGGALSFGVSSLEVVKGSQSALYGSEAVAGLIDMRTDGRLREGYDTTITAEGGSFGTLSLGLSTVKDYDRGRVSFTLSHIRSEGISARAGDAEADGYDSTALTLGIEHDLTNAITVGLSLLDTNSEVEFDRAAETPWGPADNTGYYTKKERGLRLFGRYDNGGMVHEISATSFSTSRIDPLASAPSTREFSGNRRSLSYLGTYDFSERSGLSFGLEYKEESVALDATMNQDSTRSANFEYRTAPTDTLDLSLALRYDDHSDFGSAITGRFATAWQATPNMTVRAVAGTGFRAPSLYERYSPYGNTALSEETSKSFELGIERSLGSDDFVKATLFYNEIDDRIDYVSGSTACTSPFGCYEQVAGTTLSQGVELSGKKALTDTVTVYGSYTYVDSKTDGARSPRTPMHDLVFGIEASFSPKVSGQMEVQHIGGVTPSIFAPVGHKVRDYTLVNAGISYEINKATSLSLRIDNLTNEDYETAGGFNMPGRAAYFGISASF